jgi:hypothetical protein
MIISASYKTDIPAFYGDWFLTRLRAGYCLMRNPYSGQVSRVSLRREDVDGFVFWTKNLGPFLPALAEVRRLGYPFIVQYTITGYPRAIETAVVDADRAVAHLRHVADVYGPRTAIWRYDPILFSSLTPPETHVATFTRLAAQLRGAVDEAVISFTQVYYKTRRNTDAAARAHHFTWRDPSDDEKRVLASRLTEIARVNGMQLTVCSQNHLLVPGAQPARCVDAPRLADIAGHPIGAPLKGNRPDCGCHQSRDIGEYDTCPHGCVYCYATQMRNLAKARYQRHDPAGEFLFPPEMLAPSVSVFPR